MSAAAATFCLDVEEIDPNPDQPRQSFDPIALQELADSIVGEGLMQPIVVRPANGRYEIVAGERRWRAHRIAGLGKIDAIVRTMDDHTMMVQSLIENAVRKDVTPLEEAVAFQRCIDAGMAPEDLARRLGMAPGQVYRITARMALLNLRPEYQALLRANQINTMQASAMAELSPTGQDKLFARIRAGGFDNLALRAIAAEIGENEKQETMFCLPGAPTESQRRAAISLENRFYQVVRVLRASTVDNECVAVRKVNPNRAETLAQTAEEMMAELSRIAAALRSIPQPAAA